MMGLSDLGLQLIVFRLLALLILAPVQGLAVAGAAVLLGDSGPRHDGRLTLVPPGHVAATGLIATVLFGLGWSRPVEIDARQFRIGRIGAVAVVLAGFAALLLLAALLDALVRPVLEILPHTASLTTAAFLHATGELAIWFALLSLVPVPPLTAGLLPVAAGLRLPQSARWALVALLLAAIATGFAQRALGPAQAALAAVILGD